MPWLPDFVSAVQLVRRQTRDSAHADPVAQYVATLNAGDTRPVEDAWPGEVVVNDPRAGEVRGHKQLQQFVRNSREVLTERHARTERVAAVVAGNRAVVELLVHLDLDGQPIAWPIAVVAESPDDRSVAFRSYFSRRAVDGRPHLRPAVLETGGAGLGDVIARHHAALAAGDPDAVVATFAADGYYREPIGPHRVHRGTAELRAYFTACLQGGGVDREPCTVTDDGTRCAVEYNCRRWHGRPVPTQAGIAVYDRTKDGVLAAARIYDDVDPANDEDLVDEVDGARNPASDPVR
jgi:hypothetical protein